jgi:hypothetical protein
LSVVGVRAEAEVAAGEAEIRAESPRRIRRHTEGLRGPLTTSPRAGRGLGLLILLLVASLFFAGVTPLWLFLATVAALAALDARYGWDSLLLLLVGLVIAVASGLSTEYAGKVIGGPWDYLKLFISGFTTKVLLDTFVGAIDAVGVLRTARGASKSAPGRQP